MESSRSSSIEIKLLTIPANDVKELLASTIYGMEGKMQYQHKNSYERIQGQPGLRFITLRKSGRLLGTVGVIGRETKCRGEAVFASYFRYFSIPFISGIRKKNSEPGTRQSRLRGKIKTEVSSKLTTAFDDLNSHVEQPKAFYAFVEKENDWSRGLCELFGFKPIRTIRTFIFSRIAPSPDPNVKCLQEHEQKVVRERLDKEYGDHSFYFNSNVVAGPDYFVYHEKGRMVAGIKATKVEWKIVHIPGFTGFIIRKVLPYIPYLSRLFDPEEMHFAAFEAAWFEDGKEKQLLKLMESVCQSLKVNTGLIWADSESRVAATLTRNGGLGILNKLKEDVPAYIYTKFENMSPEQEVAFQKYPVYISAQDMV